jgi:hypothetical protein
MNDPTPFVAAVALSVSVGWIVRWTFDRRDLNYWRGLVTEYKDKLHNATPIEVARQIEQLKTEIAHLQAAQWRTITDDQRRRFASAVAKLDNKPALSVRFFTGNIDPECDAYARRLSQMFMDNGLSSGGGGGFPEYAAAANQGVLLVVANPQNLTEDARIIHELLTTADIKHRIAKDARADSLSEWCFVVVGSASETE